MSTNQTVLITGASAGIGKDAAKALIDAGYTVYAAARRLGAMDDLKSLGATTLKMDITREEDVQAVVDQISRERGGIDILINNAGYADQGSIEDMSQEDARAIFDVNLFGLGHLTQLALPYMREKGEGRVINISSAGGRVPLPLCGWYIASKHALEGWSDSLRMETAQFGIKVVIIEPGTINTEFNDVAFSKFVERTGNSAYRPMVDKFIKLVEGMGGSEPSVVTKVILQAASAKKPKTRYVAGNMAGTTIAVRKWFGDGVYDRMIAGMIK
ncbi:MAG: oxidoreductase [Myxococcota bacterium]